jgi:transcriptional regulator with XRE-family HTH domain
MTDTLITARQIAVALDREMARQGKSRADVARALNIPAQYVTRYLNNTRGPTVAEAALIAKGLGKIITYRLRSAP